LFLLRRGDRGGGESKTPRCARRKNESYKGLGRRRRFSFEPWGGKSKTTAKSWVFGGKKKRRWGGRKGVRGSKIPRKKEGLPRKMSLCCTKKKGAARQRAWKKEVLQNGIFR